MIWDDDFSSEVKNLLNELLERDPNRRISISQVVRHPWLS